MTYPSIFTLLFSLALLLPTDIYADENNATAAAKAFKHDPFAKGDCTACHSDAKGTDGKLKMKTDKLCYGCHEKKRTGGYKHLEFAKGNCTSCHEPHESNSKKLLKHDTVNALCVSCHSEKAPLTKLAENMHAPMGDSCLNCHEAHASNHRYQLKANGRRNLCFECHADKKEWIRNVKNKHGAIDRQKQCLGCHDAHGTGNPSILKEKTTKDACLTCHNGPIRSIEDSKMLLNMEKHLDENPDWHGPINTGDCSICHNPHGSDNFRILRHPFPKDATTKFDEKKYICLQCHTPGKIKDKTTTTETNFRSGDRNLHNIHVVKARLTCRICHDFHGTKDLPHHLRTRSEFGSAKFSLRYIETPTGGSCNPICHNQRKYDRVNPQLK